MVILTGWKYAAFVGSIVGVIGLTLYPIAVKPMIDPDYYSKLT